MKKLLLIVCAVCCSVFAVSAQQTTDQASKTKQSLKSIDWTPKYKGEINVGYAIAGEKFEFDESWEDSDGEYSYEALGKFKTVFSRPLFETTHGVQIGPYFFVGGGLGLQYYCGKLNGLQWIADDAAEMNETEPSKRWNAVMLPIFANIKFMYPVNDKFSPFLNLSLGGTVGCYSSANWDYEDSGNLYGETYNIEAKSRAQGGLYCDFGVGLHYKALNFSLGLQHQVLKLVSKEDDIYGGEYYSTKSVITTPVNAFYLKVGVNF